MLAAKAALESPQRYGIVAGPAAQGQK
jgi:hypothetical protein